MDLEDGKHVEQDEEKQGEQGEAEDVGGECIQNHQVQEEMEKWRIQH